MKAGAAPAGPGKSPELKLPINLSPHNIRRIHGRVILSDGYRNQETYLFQLLNSEGQVVDIVPVKTHSTFKVLTEGWEKNQLSPMFLPNPVQVPKDYWEEYRRAKNGYDRVQIAKKYSLLTDNAILKLKTLVLDIDSEFEKVLPVWEELRKELGIEKGYQIYKTKSGRFRAYIFLSPSVFEKKWKEVVEGEVVERRKRVGLWLTPHEKGENGHTHLQNARELLHIIYAYFEKHGLKADHTFPNRINHPVWVEGWEIEGRKSELVEEKKGYAGKLYDLYRRAKGLQKKEELWTFNGVNLTTKFWNIEPPVKGRKGDGKIVVPSFVAKAQVKALDDFARWQIAVRRLAEKHTSYRFTKVMLPAIGWAKDLGLDRYEVYSYLRELLPDKANFDDDFERAWKYADCSFKWKGRRTKLDVRDKLMEFLENCKGGAPRQFLLKEVFNGQNWLLQLIERFSLKEELISLEKQKLTPGPGRKSYVYTLTEKGKSFLEALRDNAQEVSLSLAVGFGIGEIKKAIYNSSSEGEGAVPERGRAGGWLERAKPSEDLGRQELSPVVRRGQEEVCSGCDVCPDPEHPGQSRRDDPGRTTSSESSLVRERTNQTPVLFVSGTALETELRRRLADVARRNPNVDRVHVHHGRQVYVVVRVRGVIHGREYEEWRVLGRVTQSKPPRRERKTPRWLRQRQTDDTRTRAPRRLWE